MSQTINPKAYLFEKSIKALFGFKPNYYAEHKDPERGYCVAFVAQQGHNLTFQQLNALSALLGTDEIDFSTGREGHWHSTRTFDDGSPPEFNRCPPVGNKKNSTRTCYIKMHFASIASKRQHLAVVGVVIHLNAKTAIVERSLTQEHISVKDATKMLNMMQQPARLL